MALIWRLNYYQLVKYKEFNYISKLSVETNYTNKETLSNGGCEKKAARRYLLLISGKSNFLFHFAAGCLHQCLASTACLVSTHYFILTRTTAIHLLEKGLNTFLHLSHRHKEERTNQPTSGEIPLPRDLLNGDHHGIC